MRRTRGTRREETANSPTVRGRVPDPLREGSVAVGVLKEYVWVEWGKRWLEEYGNCDLETASVDKQKVQLQS